MQMALNHCELLNFAPSQWCTNAATFTALNQNGEVCVAILVLLVGGSAAQSYHELTRVAQVYTWSFDRRFPKCLGRPFAEGIGPYLNDSAAQIPYFSETKIQKIASGGYYSAAITDDGELYVWGQASPTPAGARCELGVLQDKADEDEDEFVRSVRLEIDGRPAKAVDVSVGWGHLLVVVEAKDDSQQLTTAVFAAGRNEHGQLASLSRRGSVQKFAELPEFRGWAVEQLVCTGYTSYVVVRRRPGCELGRTLTSGDD